MRGVDYYKILGVSRGASTTEIKKRYQTLASKYHPDHDGDNSLMSLVNEAYKVLSDPQMRFKYNKSLDEKEKSVVQQPQSPAYSPTPTYTHYDYGKVQPKVKKRKSGWATIAFIILGLIVYGSLGSTQNNSTSASSTPSSSYTPTASTSTQTTPSLSTTPTTNTNNYTAPTTTTPTYTPSYSTPTYSTPSPTSCSSNNIGSTSYTNCYGGGGSTNCSTNSIGSSDYTNCYGSGGSTHCTTNYIGDSKYTNCY